LKLKVVGDVSAFALAADGEILATAEAERIRLWDIASGAALRHFDCHRGDITALAFSADGRVRVSGSADTTALVWDIVRLVAGRERRRIDLSRPQLEAMWHDLAGDATLCRQ
jgi:WD40 repeat protein